MGNKLRHEGDEVRIKVIWPDIYIYIYISHESPLSPIILVKQPLSGDSLPRSAWETPTRRYFARLVLYLAISDLWLCTSFLMGLELSTGCEDEVPPWVDDWGLSENSVLLNPMVNDHYPY